MLGRDEQTKGPPLAVYASTPASYPDPSYLT